MKNRPFVVAISGDPVSGKSSAIKGLMKAYEALGFSEDTSNGKVMVKFAAGQLFRDIAREVGLTVEQLTNMAKRTDSTIETIMNLPNANKEFFAKFQVNIFKGIDEFIDEYMLLKVKEAIQNLQDYEEAIIIVDSRIIGLLMKRDREEVFNVRFSVLPEIAAKRLISDAANRKNEVSKEIDINAALLSVKNRALEDRRRFIRVYSNDLKSREENAKVDLQNHVNYDLIIDTSGVSSGEVVNILLNCLEKARKHKYFHKQWRSTKYVFTAESNQSSRWHLLIEEAKVLRVEGHYYALSATAQIDFLNEQGRKIEERTGTEDGYKLIPIEVLAENAELFFYQDECGEMIGTTAEEFVEKYFNLKKDSH